MGLCISTGLYVAVLHSGICGARAGLYSHTLGSWTAVYEGAFGSFLSEISLSVEGSKGAEYLNKK